MDVKWPMLRRSILEVTRPVLTLTGKFHTPPHYRSVTKNDVDSLRSKLMPGDVLLSHRSFELTNPIIPGFWKHAAIYFGDGLLIEATGKGVRVAVLQEFCMTKDSVVALRALFASRDESRLAAGFALSLKGLPYDYLVEHEFSRTVNQAFYCSEIPWWGYEQVFVAAGKKSPFEPCLTLGVPTIAPQDYRLAKAMWGEVLKVGKAVEKL